jgi:hypothetical protein
MTYHVFRRRKKIIFMSTLQKPRQAPLNNSIKKRGAASGATISVNVLYRAQSKLIRSRQYAFSPPSLGENIAITPIQGTITTEA